MQQSLDWPKKSYITILVISDSKVRAFQQSLLNFRSSHPEVFLGKCVLKKCSKFAGEHACRSVISIKLQSNFIEIIIWHGRSPVHLLHIFRTAFPRNAFGRLLLNLTLPHLEYLWKGKEACSLICERIWKTASTKILRVSV